MELDVSQPIHLPAGRLEILSDRDELHTTWTCFAAHRDGAAPHVHRKHSDLFYVLDGEFTILAGPDRTETAIGPGTLVHAPPLVVHGFRDASDGELRYLSDFTRAVLAARNEDELAAARTSFDQKPA